MRLRCETSFAVLRTWGTELWQRVARAWSHAWPSRARELALNMVNLGYLGSFCLSAFDFPPSAAQLGRMQRVYLGVKIRRLVPVRRGGAWPRSGGYRSVCFPAKAGGR